MDTLNEWLIEKGDAVAPVSERPIYRIPRPWMDAYDGMEDHDNRLRLETSRRDKDLVARWLVALSLLAEAFAPGVIYDTPEPDNEIKVRAYSLQLQLLGLAGRGAKPALDEILAGYYSEAFALIRSMLEGWGREVYVRLRPHEYHRWYASESDPNPGEPQKQEPSFGGEIRTVIESAGNADDKTLFTEARLRYRLLNTGSHPSGEGITQIFNYNTRKMYFQSSYQEDFCHHCFNHGLFTLLALLGEVERLGPRSEKWVGNLSALRERWEPLRRSFQRVLDEEAERLAAEEEAKRAAREAMKAKCEAKTKAGE